MQNDEKEIRNLVETWMSATKAGDTETVLSLMTDDVIFLRSGHAPMDKSEFALALQVQGSESPQFDGESDIKEIKVLGEWAFMWANLEVKVTFPGKVESVNVSGHTLSILKKQNGKWAIARDANMLA